MIRRVLGASALLIMISCSSAGGTDDSPTKGNVTIGNGGTGGTAGVPTGALAAGISVSQVSLFQTVEVPLMNAGMQIDTRTVPVVIGKDAVLRVFFQPDASFQARQVTVSVTFENDSGAITVPPITGTLTTASTEDSLASTANFPIPGSAIGSNTRYSVSIREVSADVSVAGDSTGAIWPATGSQKLLERVTNMGTKVTLVPMRYDADGSMRLPDTTDATVGLLRARMLALYPAPSVTITVSDPLPYPNSVSPTNGNDWSTLLQSLLQYRQSSGAAPDEYYYGMILPVATEQDFCSGGCIAGLTSSVTNGPSEPMVRGSVGVGFPGADTIETFVHEVGHAHTLRHAPCSSVGPIQNVDPNYPYSMGQIGVWGLDVVANELKGPNAFDDMMGYCDPTWISDYHYSQLATEMEFVSSSSRAIFPADFPKKWQVISVDAAGKGTLGVTMDVDSFPSGDKVDVTVREGTTEQQVSGYMHPFGDLPGGLVFVPIANGSHPESYRLGSGDVAMGFGDAR